MRRSTLITLLIFSLWGLARAEPPPGDDEIPPVADQPASNVTKPSEIERREATLASREAHLELLRASISNDNPEQLKLENMLQDEIAADRAAIEALRGGQR